MLYADVVLPLPLSSYFTYAIPSDMQGSLVSGSRVVVPFGRRKQYTGIVTHLHDTAPVAYEVKSIIALLDETPILRRPQLKLWEWIANYYLCSVGEVYKAALPSGLKLESETMISLCLGYEEEKESPLDQRERVLLDTLAQKQGMTIDELEKESGLRNVMPTVRLLLEREAVTLTESLRRAYRPKQEVYVALTFTSEQKEELRAAFDALKQAKKQTQLLLAYLDLSHFMRTKEPVEVARKMLLTHSQVTQGVLDALIERGVMRCYRKEVSRLVPDSAATTSAAPLTQAQQEAYVAIHETFKRTDVVLLHGVTSSGKTEVYIHLIDDALRQGKQVLYLVPEIALTTQLTTRLQRVFGDKLAIYHSKFSDNERVETWNALLNSNQPRVVLGVRSSVFLPFFNLGLVIVDEEHEASYKQQDPSPRYHARNVAVVLASMHGGKVLLGSATPAIESYYNAQQGKYGLVRLSTRYSDLAMPEILVADVRELRRRREMKDNFSPQLITLAHEALARGEQVIFFQNRRGFSPLVECRQCAWVPKCDHCDVSLTYHKRYHQLTCHYCGAAYALPRQCPLCGSTEIEHRGFGTERIEEDTAAYFPQVPLARMDLDTARSRKAYEELITAFETGKTRILIGTQMVSKGLDFDGVSVVGILSGDAIMNYPDFRAHERAFQQMTQVAGRAGRKHKQGKVVLQISDPTHPLVKQVIENDYLAMYHTQLAERQAFNYPPYYRLIYITLRHRDEATLHTLAVDYAILLRHVFAERVLGPDNPPVARVNALHIRKIMLKVETTASQSRVRQLLGEVYLHALKDDRFKTLLISYDVDPV